MFLQAQNIATSAARMGIIIGLLGMSLMVAPGYAADNNADEEAKQQAKIEIRETRKQIRKVMRVAREKMKQAVRGGQVYKTYCVLCHGENGAGDGPLSVVHDGLTLKINKQSPEFYEKIVTGGGEAVGRSAFMPTWQDELSEEQIDDVVMYLSMLADPVRRGEVVFKTSCILCHGVNGDGMGRASVLFDPPPADLTRSDKNDTYKKMIITMGGAAMGRSEVMPIWGQELSEQQIDDVVAYLRTILVIPPPD